METHTFADPELSPRQMTWAWPGYIPRRCMTEGYGEGGTMKGLAVQSLIALFTIGAPMPDGSRGFVGPRTVISITGEDLLREAMAWRYRAAGADTRNIIDMSRDENGRPFKLTDKGLARIREEICRINTHERGTRYQHMPDFGGLYMDPMMSIAPRNVSQNTTFRAVLLEPLDALCYEFDSFCWLMNHTTKDGKTVAGSAAATQGPRMVLGFRQNEANPLNRELFRMKTNVTKNTEVPVIYTDEGHDTSLRVRWLTPWEDSRVVAQPKLSASGPVPASPPPGTSAPGWQRLTPAQMWHNLNEPAQ
jgi:AAA domain